MEEIPSTSNAAIPPSWEDIERSESYLVCCMYEEAASLSHSVLKRLCEINSKNNKPYYEIVESGDELDDMFESAGMVYVQSLNQLGRTLEILKELKLLFGSVTAIPVQVFLTGSNLEPSLPGMSPDKPAAFLLIFKKFLRNSLARLWRNVDLAVSWVEKASLPEEKRQFTDNFPNLYTVSFSAFAKAITLHGTLPKAQQFHWNPPQHHYCKMDEYGTKSASIKERRNIQWFCKQFQCENNTKQALKKMYKNKRVPFWWFRTITLKFGNTTRIETPTGRSSKEAAGRNTSILQENRQLRGFLPQTAVEPSGAVAVLDSNIGEEGREVPSKMRCKNSVTTWEIRNETDRRELIRNVVNA
nr:protein APEM9 [Ipomoea batatas]